MEAVTGKAIVTSMMRLATEMSSWNKAYATEGKVAKRIEELGLTPHQAQMLGFLYSNPELDTVSALSARLHVSKGSLSLMLSKLEAGGFVQKKAAKDGDDGRKIYISLTAKGESAVQEMVELRLCLTVWMRIGVCRFIQKYRNYWNYSIQEDGKNEKAYFDCTCAVHGTWHSLRQERGRGGKDPALR